MSDSTDNPGREPEVPSVETAKTLDQAVERLLAADEMDSKQSYSDGYEAGQRWAREDARPTELRRLQRLVKDEFFDYREKQDMAVGHLICLMVFQVDPDDDGPIDQVEVFWEKIIGKDALKKIDNYDFADGWIAGALNFWGQARRAAKQKGKDL